MTSLYFGAFQERSALQVRDQNIFRQDVYGKQYEERPDIYKPPKHYSSDLMPVSYPKASRNRSSCSNPAFVSASASYEPCWDDNDEWNRDGFLDLPEDFIPPRHGFLRRARKDDVPKVPAEEIHLPNGFVHLREHDVVCGRGAPTLVHPGNQAYRTLIQQHEKSYLCAKRADKPIIATEVIETLNNRKVKFVRRERNSSGSGWVALDEKKVYEKVCQSLREGAPELRRKILASDARSTPERPKAMTQSHHDRENHLSILTP